MGKEIFQNSGRGHEPSQFSQQKGVAQWHQRNNYALLQLRNLGFNGNGDIKDKKILDVGCGAGGLVELFSERGAYSIGLDFPGVIKQTRRQIPEDLGKKFIAGDFTEGKSLEILGRRGFDYVIFHGLVDPRDKNNGGKEGAKSRVSDALKLIKPGGEIRIYPVDSPEEWKDVSKKINSERQGPEIIFEFRQTIEKKDVLDVQNKVLIIREGNRVNFQA